MRDAPARAREKSLMNLPRMERVRALARGRGTEIAAKDYGLTYSREIMEMRHHDKMALRNA
jgi:hypothetical protein